MGESKNWYLICYDIRDPKRWRQAYKQLEGYGERLQFSIFRCRLTPREREKLRWQLEKILTKEDSLLIVGLCSQCVERVCACNRAGTWPMSEQNFKIF
ncbi:MULTISPECIES: CRISPR-associated endonuclease Cas2 [unclassified Thermosynechococcus]|uniref:CRISPR-associated endonuclease Cas2 n=1 Tax=unclassified Thermosynechococcus TaxID=2622553 RepID=UPI00122DD6A5|nr:MULTISPECIES: CRISPR-associated endonuclease Cas2 [unclassified Thermosynechococcus]MDR5639743.1 CRISPR-associated endonuclease Cas2 [Thermosynechococcus sp. PP42]MDR7898825.1 CRISPR-associated endonuclease Cas2 [Thermosynechococcus sp. JY1332]MDR7906230.1 CRISPR-associated endonuclease Cas2 [Thermosynechococcus sp. JY1334]MDR7921591.1 CRISPR-associated endonuclease Cas2 [Thermosynechococcus sp. HY213]MDR7994050.1 CRISPR-associated endonuclease Cas2 [Thermosynechococcus sp. TG252]